MKKIFSLFVLGIAILLSACSTENPTNPNPTSASCIGPQPKFQYKVNGELRVINATFDPRFGWKNEYLSGSGDQTFNYLPRLISNSRINEISCFSQSILLHLRFSSIINGTGTFTNNHPEEFRDPSIYINGEINHTVNISRYTNGTVDGTFTATVTNGTLTANITEGQFSNIPVVAWFD
jgi:hypothetical protein